MRAQLAIERADVCIIMLDARDGVTEQDTKIAGLAHEAGKASLIVVNKWDLVEKDGKTMDKLRKDVYLSLIHIFSSISVTRCSISFCGTLAMRRPCLLYTSTTATARARASGTASCARRT